MLLYFGGDYIKGIIDNAVPKVEGYNATVEYLNKHLDPKTNDTFEMNKFQKTIQDSNERVQKFCNRVRSIASRDNFENEDKHIKTQLILGTHFQKTLNSALLIPQYLSKGLLTEENYLTKSENKRALLTAKVLTKLKT